MNRKLAVRLAVGGVLEADHNRYFRRILRDDEDEKDIEILKKLAENRRRIDVLLRDFEHAPNVAFSPDTSNEIDYIKASIQLGLLEITGELAETPDSEEVFEQAMG